MSSFTARCPALLSLGQPLAKADSIERLMRLMVANGTDERVLALRTNRHTTSFGMVSPLVLPAACEGWLHGEVDELNGCKRHRRACLGAAH